MPPRRAISSGVEHLPYKEGVAGSNPASPTIDLPGNTENLRQRNKAGTSNSGPFTATVLQPEYPWTTVRLRALLP